MSTYRAIRVGVLVAAMWFGCGSDEKEGGDKTPIKVGFLNPSTGALHETGPQLGTAVLLAQAEVNAAGGIRGRPFELLSRDSMSDPAAALAAATELIEKEGVKAIIQTVGSGLTARMSELTIAKQVLVVTSASTSPAITAIKDDGLIMRTLMSDELQAQVLAQEVYDDGHRTAALLHVDNGFANGVTGAFKPAFEKLGGAVPIDRRYADNLPETYDFSADLSAVTDTTPAAIFLASYAEGAHILTRWHQSSKWTGAWYLAHPMRREDIVQNVGQDIVEGMKGTSPAPTETTRFARFLELYEDKLDSPPTGPQLFMAGSYDCAATLALAYAKAGPDATGIELRDAMRAIANPPGDEIGPGELARGLKLLEAGKDIDYQGAASATDFSDDGDVLQIVEVWQFRGGKIVQVRTVAPE